MDYLLAMMLPSQTRLTLAAPAEANSQQAPQFVLASADEHKTKSAVDVARVTGVPAWRIVLGNVAAGATAGCAVEAGTTRIAPCRVSTCSAWCGTADWAESLASAVDVTIWPPCTLKHLLTWCNPCCLEACAKFPFSLHCLSQLF